MTRYLALSEILQLQSKVIDSSGGSHGIRDLNFLGGYDLPLISTTYKATISRELAYPVGAELVSKHLAGCHRFDELELWFTAYGGPAPDKVKAKTASGDSMLVLGAEYVNREQIAWRVTVHAMLVSNKSVVRSRICNEGLGLIQEWLEAPRTEIWKQARRKACYFYWNPVSGSTEFDEKGESRGIA
jgi:hypothetical protein